MPDASVAAAANDEGTSVSSESQRRRVSRVAKSDGRAEGEDEPGDLEVRGPDALAGQQEAAADDQDGAGDQPGLDRLVDRNVSANTTEKSGAVPTSTEVRDGPASRTASVNSTCDPPGPMMPASANTQIPERSGMPSRTASAAAKASVTASAGIIVSTAPTSALAPPASAKRSATVIAPNRAAEQTARSTASTACEATRVADPRVEAYARLLVGRCIDAQAGWQVLLAAPVTGRPLAEAISRELARRGAYVLPRLYFDVPLTLGLPWLLDAPEQLLERFPPLEQDVLDRVDAGIFVLGGSVTRLWDVPLDRVRHLRAQVSEYRRRGRAGEIPTVLCDVPDEGLAADAGLAVDEFEEIVYAACLRDWDADVDAMDPIREALDRASEVRIVADGTDVTLGVEGRTALIDDGHLNMPGGEVFCCPLEDSAEGVVTFSEFAQRGWGGLVEGARLVLRDGVVVDASAARGEDVLQAALDTDDGSRRVGELGIGCNTGVTRYLRNVLYDEKMAGTVHIALGAGLPIAGGSNPSALHWDLVKDLRHGGRLFFDGELVQENGRWLH